MRHVSSTPPLVITAALCYGVAKVRTRSAIVPTREDKGTSFCLSRWLPARRVAQDTADVERAAPLTLPDSESTDS